MIQKAYSRVEDAGTIIFGRPIPVKATHAEDFVKDAKYLLHGRFTDRKGGMVAILEAPDGSLVSVPRSEAVGLKKGDYIYVNDKGRLEAQTYYRSGQDRINQGEGYAKDGIAKPPFQRSMGSHYRGEGGVYNTLFLTSIYNRPEDLPEGPSYYVETVRPDGYYGSTYIYGYAYEGQIRGSKDRNTFAIPIENANGLSPGLKFLIRDGRIVDLSNEQKTEPAGSWDYESEKDIPTGEAARSERISVIRTPSIEGDGIHHYHPAPEEIEQGRLIDVVPSYPVLEPDPRLSDPRSYKLNGRATDASLNWPGPVNSQNPRGYPTIDNHVGAYPLLPDTLNYVTGPEDLVQDGEYDFQGLYYDTERGNTYGVFSISATPLLAVTACVPETTLPTSVLKMPTGTKVRGRDLIPEPGNEIIKPPVPDLDNTMPLGAGQPSPNGWYWVCGERACEECSERNGIFFPMSREFKPLHPNCMCAPEYAFLPNPRYGTEEKYPITLGKEKVEAVQEEEAPGPDHNPWKNPPRDSDLRDPSNLWVRYDGDNGNGTSRIYTPDGYFIGAFPRYKIPFEASEHSWLEYDPKEGTFQRPKKTEEREARAEAREAEARQREREARAEEKATPRAEPESVEPEIRPPERPAPENTPHLKGRQMWARVVRNGPQAELHDLSGSVIAQVPYYKMPGGDDTRTGDVVVFDPGPGQGNETVSEFPAESDYERDLEEYQEGLSVKKFVKKGFCTLHNKRGEAYIANVSGLECLSRGGTISDSPRAAPASSSSGAGARGSADVSGPVVPALTSGTAREPARAVVNLPPEVQGDGQSAKITMNGQTFTLRAVTPVTDGELDTWTGHGHEVSFEEMVEYASGGLGLGRESWRYMNRGMNKWLKHFNKLVNDSGLKEKAPRLYDLLTTMQREKERAAAAEKAALSKNSFTPEELDIKPDTLERSIQAANEGQLSYGFKGIDGQIWWLPLRWDEASGTFKFLNDDVEQVWLKHLSFMHDVEKVAAQVELDETIASLAQISDLMFMLAFPVLMGKMLGYTFPDLVDEGYYPAATPNAPGNPRSTSELVLGDLDLKTGKYAASDVFGNIHSIPASQLPGLEEGDVIKPSGLGYSKVDSAKSQDTKNLADWMSDNPDSYVFVSRVVNGKADICDGFGTRIGFYDAASLDAGQLQPWDRLVRVRSGDGFKIDQAWRSKCSGRCRGGTAFVYDGAGNVVDVVRKPPGSSGSYSNSDSNLDSDSDSGAEVQKCTFVMMPSKGGGYHRVCIGNIGPGARPQRTYGSGNLGMSIHTRRRSMPKSSMPASFRKPAGIKRYQAWLKNYVTMPDGSVMARVGVAGFGAGGSDYDFYIPAKKLPGAVPGLYVNPALIHQDLPEAARREQERQWSQRIAELQNANRQRQTQKSIEGMNMKTRFIQKGFCTLHNRKGEPFIANVSGLECISRGGTISDTPRSGSGVSHAPGPNSISTPQNKPPGIKPPVHMGITNQATDASGEPYDIQELADKAVKAPDDWKQSLASLGKFAQDHEGAQLLGVVDGRAIFQSQDGTSFSILADNLSDLARIGDIYGVENGVLTIDPGDGDPVNPPDDGGFSIGPNTSQILTDPGIDPVVVLTPKGGTVEVHSDAIPKGATRGSLINENGDGGLELISGPLPDWALGPAEIADISRREAASAVREAVENGAGFDTSPFRSRNDSGTDPYAGMSEKDRQAAQEADMAAAERAAQAQASRVDESIPDPYAHMNEKERQIAQEADMKAADRVASSNNATLKAISISPGTGGLEAGRSRLTAARALSDRGVDQVYVDRIEGDRAVLYDGEGYPVLDMPATALPAGAEEGTWMNVTDNGMIVNQAATQNARYRVSNLQQKLTRKGIITKMDLAQIGPGTLARVPKQEVLQVWHRLNQWFSNARAKGHAIEDIVNAAVWTMKEMEERGIEYDRDLDLVKEAEDLRDHIRKMFAPGVPTPLRKALADIPDEVVLIPGFVSVVGSSVLKADAHDLDILFRADRTPDDRFLLNSENVRVALRKALDPAKQGIMGHFMDNPQGSHSDSVPVYSLVLRKEEPRVEVVKSLDPFERFHPEKPLMAGYTDFFRGRQ